MSVQAMFHGGPLDGDRMMLNEAVPIFCAPTPPTLTMAPAESDLTAPSAIRYEREKLTPELLAEALAHRVAIRYFEMKS